MKKIISLFKRNYEGNRQVYNEVVPGAEWVIDGEGKATRKIDGTCCLIKNGELFKRYDVKQGKTPPIGFIPAQEPDPITGHWPGWLPISKEDRYHNEAFHTMQVNGQVKDGTFELIGPKINGNPENEGSHFLIEHGIIIFDDCPRNFEELK